MSLVINLVRIYIGISEDVYFPPVFQIIPVHTNGFTEDISTYKVKTFVKTLT